MCVCAYSTNEKVEKRNLGGKVLVYSKNIFTKFNILGQNCF